MDNKPTHTATQPNRQIQPIDAVKGLLAKEEYMKQITNYFRGDRDEALAFLTSSVAYIRKVPKLLETNRDSLLSALLTSAQFRFMPVGVNGEAYIIPYGSEAKFQLGYQGYVTLFYRAGVKSIKANIVYSNEHFRYEEGIDTILEHTPTKFGDKKGDPIGVYCVAITPTGGKVFKVMSKDEIMNIKEISKAKDKKDSPWNSGDPELWMWKKTCLIQLAKLLPKTAEIQKAIETDFEGEGMNKPQLDVAGIGTGKANHQPTPPTDEGAQADAPEEEVITRD